MFRTQGNSLADLLDPDRTQIDRSGFQTLLHLHWVSTTGLALLPPTIPRNGDGSSAALVLTIQWRHLRLDIPGTVSRPALSRHQPSPADFKVAHYPFFAALIFAQRARCAAAIRFLPAADILRLGRAVLFCAGFRPL